MGYRVVLLLRRLEESVIVVAARVNDEWKTELEEIGVQIIIGDAANERLLQKAQISTARAIIIVTDNDLANVSIMLDSKRANPHIAIVLRLFNQQLAPQIEASFAVRRALSTSLLAAPAFAAAALDSSILGSFSWQGRQHVLARFKVGTNSSFAARTPANIRLAERIHIIAVFRAGHLEMASPDSGDIEPGDELVVFADVAVWEAYGREYAPESPQRKISGSEETHTTQPRSPVKSAGKQKFLNAVLRRVVSFLSLRTLSMPSKILLSLLGVITLTSTLFFHHTLNIPAIDALYFVVTTITTVGYGDINLLAAPPSVKIYGALLMFSGAALIASFYTLLTNFIIKARFAEFFAGARVKARDHIIVVGLGALGFRLVNELRSLGEKVVVIEKNPNAEFREALPKQIAVVSGDGSIAAVLDRAGIARAESVIAVTGNDITNLSVGLLAKSVNRQVRTTLRLFDPELAAKVQSDMEINAAMSASALAAPAFVGNAFVSNACHAAVIEGWLIVLAEGSFPGFSEEYKEAGFTRLLLPDETLPAVVARPLKSLQ